MSQEDPQDCAVSCEINSDINLRTDRMWKSDACMNFIDEFCASVYIVESWAIVQAMSVYSKSLIRGWFINAVLRRIGMEK